jgi:parallel beta-helix repeat protein
MRIGIRFPMLQGIAIVGILAQFACGGSGEKQASTQGPVPEATIAVAITPGTTELVAGLGQSFTATVSGATDTTVTWAVDDIQGGNATVGTLAGTGNTVTYTAPAEEGSHVLTATSVVQSSKRGSTTVHIRRPQINIGLTPGASSLSVGGSLSFTATVSGSTNTAVTWTVDGVTNGNTSVGTISGTGNTITYRAPATAGTRILSARSTADSTKSASSTLTVQAVPIPPPASVSVAVTPTSTSLAIGSTSAFTAAVSGSTNTAVTWAVDGVVNGNATVGTLSGTGNTVTYTAPASAGSHILTATSAADSSKSASASVTIQGSCIPTPRTSWVVDVKTYGAKGNGVADDTSAIQAALNAVGGTGGTLLIPDGTYMVNTTLNNGQGLQVPSDMTLRLASLAVLKAIPNASQGYSILYLPRVTNVNIIGGTLEGERSAHTGTGGESGMGIFVASSQNVVIEGVTARECWGDGFYIGGSIGSKNITLCHVVADHNRRQGLSVVYADGVLVRNSIFQNTKGTDPEAGIDIEPNAGETVNNMQILNCTLTSNAGGGILSGPGAADIGIAFATNVVIDGNTFIGNGSDTSSAYRGGIGVSSSGGYRITNNTVQDSVGWGIQLRNYAHNSVVSGNRVTGSGGDGIFVGEPCTGFTLTNNTVTGNAGYGIYQASGIQGTVSGNTVSGNGKTP